ncbi:hypothetical protein TBLA_0J01950 [Henningerozyma blattae CBS 6284]|uniref:Letm1 RBD domain-containing protein n=1 Tax=Henningerozyma blattae (strain ATCC 34711 / CBS 6284 / DSM 70876 / NBRC 10599 / NRRL Y-10934 / UCD 77-7) TaxID=1071380 RepID=I2H9Y7_HENB6|nr:hypothetical protein TBLA_0J01950 [Tetrapisispora blattae CBS 6284]CCH63189.1 hypothetical protein TBLA_0J01950 [Tetrapisispora blattae CBS 6284]
MSINSGTAIIHLTRPQLSFLAPSLAATRIRSSSSISLGRRIRKEITHYINGTKLLANELSDSVKLVVRMTQGDHMKRRELIQLRKTADDLFRLLPFSAFIIIPFAELLLPFCLKLFPNLLPSTYETGDNKMLKLIRLAENKSIISSLLRNTLNDSKLNIPLYNNHSKQIATNKEIFNKFFYRLKILKRNGYSLAITKLSFHFTEHEVLQVAKLFKDDTLLISLTKRQLSLLNQYMSLSLPSLGTMNLLKYRLRHTLNKIKKDDILIAREGVTHLTDEELYEACMSRGIQIQHETDLLTHKSVMRKEMIKALENWLLLRLKHHIPMVLLILATTAPSNISTHWSQPYVDGIFEVLCMIPDSVYTLAKLDISASVTPYNNCMALTNIEDKPLIKYKR